MNREEIVRRARWVGELAERYRAESEARCDLHPEVAGALLESELLKVLRPKHFGGWQLDPTTYVDVVRELSYRDGSAGWVYSVLEIHEWWLAYADRELQEEIWDDKEAPIVDSLAPVGRAVQVNGQWRVEGHWRFVSGISLAKWVAVNALATFDEALGPEPALFVLPKQDVRVVEDWNPVGLRGTGSHSIIVEEALVPPHRVLRLMPIATTGIPRNPELQDESLYRVPFVPMLAAAIYAPALGLAQRAVDEYRQWLTRRVRPYELGAKATEQPGFQTVLAEAIVLLDAAQALSDRYCAELETLGSARQSHDDPERRSRFFAQRAWIARTCLQVVEKLFLASGANALFHAHPLQQVWRDAHAVAQHVAVIYEDGLSSLGRTLVGLSGHPLL